MPSHRSNASTRINKYRKTAERLSSRRQNTADRLCSRTADSDPSEVIEIFSADTLIGGKFRIISLLGLGGMGIVYLAEHVVLRKRYALKVLAPELVNEQNWLRFKSEAKILAALNHPTLAKVYDLGIHDNTVPFYTMDYLEGSTVEDLLCSDQPLTVDRSIDIFIAVLEGLAYAHRNGVIHRDIKPGNILLHRPPGEEGYKVKILDFGISKLLDSNRVEQYLTAIGEVFGSPYYMSPEQCAGGAVDARSDIYSVGCAIFESLTGCVPFDGETPLDTALMHQEDEIPQLSDVCEAHFPPSLDMVIARCMAKAPSDRYQSAKELALDLARIKDGKELIFSSSEHSALKGGKKGGGHTSGRALRKKQISALAILGFLAIVVGSLTCYLWLNVVGEMRSIRHGRVTEAKNAGATENVSFPEPEISGAPVLDVSPDAPWIQKSQLSHSGDMVKGSGDILVAFNRVPEKMPASVNDSSPFSSLEMINGEHYRVFHFPTDAFLGFLYSELGERASAQGLVRMRAQSNLTFVPSRLATRFPQYLKRFRPGDVYCIRLLNFACDNGMLDAIALIPGVQVLKIPACKNIDDRGIHCLTKMRQLIRLDISDTLIQPAALARLKDWDNLQSLNLGSCHEVSPMLAKLSGSKKITFLDLNHTTLKNDNFSQIAQMPALTNLNLSYTQTAPTQLKMLASLPKLKTLNLEGCPFSQEIISALRPFKSLRVVKLGLEGLPELSKGLKTELPKIDVR